MSTPEAVKSSKAAGGRPDPPSAGMISGHLGGEAATMGSGVGGSGSSGKGPAGGTQRGKKTSTKGRKVTRSRARGSSWWPQQSNTGRVSKHVHPDWRAQRRQHVLSERLVSCARQDTCSDRGDATNRGCDVGHAVRGLWNETIGDIHTDDRTHRRQLNFKALRSAFLRVGCPT